MNRNLMLGALILAALALFGGPSAAQAQDDRSGTEIWAQSCGTCHALLPAKKFEAKNWESIMTHMQITARLTDAESEAVLAFLTRGAKSGGDEEAETASAASLARAHVQSAGGVTARKPEDDKAEGPGKRSPGGN
jgi:diheme cytochrome c